jgi:iron(III) transport system permease protein
MDPTLEEAARASGAGILSTAKRVTLPLVRPAFFAAVLVAFITAFEGFETPAIIGLRSDPPIQTFSTEIFTRVRRSPTDFNASSAYALIFLATAMIGVFLYRRATRSAERYATITGKGFRPNRIDLGRWRWVTMAISFVLLTFMFILPMLALLWRSLQPYNNAPSFDTIGLLTLKHWRFVLGYETGWSSLLNSLVIAFFAALLVTLITAVAAWLVARSRIRGRSLIDAALFIPIAMPGLVLGLSFVWFSLTLTPVLYGTLIILVIAHMTRFLPYGMRFSSASIVQISAELENAAYASGATFLQTFRRITLPLLMPGLVGGFIFVFVGSVRELSASVLLYGFNNTTFPVALFDVFDDGRLGEAAALALVSVAVLSVIVLGVRWIGGRFGVRV